MCLRPQLFQDSKGLVAFSNFQNINMHQNLELIIQSAYFITTNGDKFDLLKNHFHLF
jgi:hypothetical protein